jgi:hypothetical protein
VAFFTILYAIFLLTFSMLYYSFVFVRSRLTLPSLFKYVIVEGALELTDESSLKKLFLRTLSSGIGSSGFGSIKQTISSTSSSLFTRA